MFNFNENALGDMINTALAQLVSILSDESINYIERYNLTVAIIEMTERFQQQLNDETLNSAFKIEYFTDKNGM